MRKVISTALVVFASVSVLRGQQAPVPMQQLMDQVLASRGVLVLQALSKYRQDPDVAVLRAQVLPTVFFTTRGADGLIYRNSRVAKMQPPKTLEVAFVDADELRRLDFVAPIYYHNQDKKLYFYSGIADNDWFDVAIIKGLYLAHQATKEPMPRLTREVILKSGLDSELIVQRILNIATQQRYGRLCAAIMAETKGRERPTFESWIRAAMAQRPLFDRIDSLFRTHVNDRTQHYEFMLRMNQYTVTLMQEWVKVKYPRSEWDQRLRAEYANLAAVSGR